MSDHEVPIEEISILAGHSSTKLTETVYRNPRELHQMGELLLVA